MFLQMFATRSDNNYHSFLHPYGPGGLNPYVQIMWGQQKNALVGVTCG